MERCRLSDYSPTVMQAMMLLKAGKSAAAIELVIQAREKAKEDYGPESIQYAEALYDHGSISILLDQLDYAVESLKIAVQIPPSSDEMKKNRLNYLLNLGEILTKMRNYSEAETVLRTNMKERAEYYGTERGAYGFALDSLARVLLKSKNYSEAESLAIQAVEIFRKEGNPQYYSSIAFRGLCTKAVHGTAKPAFTEFGNMQEQQTNVIYENSIRLAETHEPHYSSLFLFDLRDSLIQAGLVNDIQIFILGMQIDLLSRKMKENEIRIQELEWTLQRPEIQNRKDMQAELLMALGIAYTDVENLKAAEKAFKDAESRASDANNNSIRARVLRNYAQMMTKKGKMKDAKKALEKGLKLAIEANDSIVIGRLQIALGINHIRQGKGLDGNISLNEGLMKIPRTHPDKILAHATRGAMKKGLTVFPSDDEEQILSLAVLDLLANLMLSFDQINVSVELDGSEYPVINIELRSIPESRAASINKTVEWAKSEVQEMYMNKGQFIPL